MNRLMQLEEKLDSIEFARPLTRKVALKPPKSKVKYKRANRVSSVSSQPSGHVPKDNLKNLLGRLGFVNKEEVRRALERSKK